MRTNTAKFLADHDLFLAGHDVKDFGVRLLACFVILWTPFFFFSRFRGHPVPATGLAYSAISFAIVAVVLAMIMGRPRGVKRVAVFSLIVCLFLSLQVPQFEGVAAYLGALVIGSLFWFIREHLATILASVFSIVLLTSLLGTTGEPYVDHRTEIDGANAANAAAEAPATKPSGLIVHLILDGFTGLPGIPDEIDGSQALKLEIANFFRSYGFALHTNAISEYAASRASISGILNFDASDNPEQHFHGRRPFVLKNNRYFEWLRQRGFGIHVTQATYLDFCAESPVPLESCFTYRYDGTDWLRSAELDARQKTAVLLGMFFNLPGFFESGWKAYVKLRAATERVGFSLPVVMAWDGIVAPVTSMSAFARFRKNVLHASHGSAHFGHLLLPHSPYVFDSECKLRDQPLRWLSSHPLYEKDNTSSGRARRYAQYFAQVRCTLEQLRPLFDGLIAQGRWTDTKIILHGDHGSRLYETAPRTKNLNQLTSQDLTDAYSTLFAVKWTADKAAEAGESGENVGVDTWEGWQTGAADHNETAPISRLLGRMTGAFHELNESDKTLSVYLEGQNDEPWKALAWPESR